jgi:TolB-like protein/Tfp pilus assembly protein PilF
MASLIPGYEYDIFISYRQKDNKHDGWVTEFVNNLKGELESTFKEDISVYFDINPHDGLLETHDVDASLKEKLKCLIFIPIISRTYCDPKSFAWEHEFKAFIELASHDQFGLKVKLPNSNVANRVLPIRIHDLETEDVKLFEGVTGGAMRTMDFVFKTTSGVNRPLKAKEDHPNDNLNKTYYQDQINKVSLAIKEIIPAVGQHIPQKEEVPNEVFKPISVPRKNNKTKIIAGSIITIGVIVFGFLFVPKFIKPSEQLEKSIAVLPFKSLSDDPAQQYLADGTMDAILLHLQKFKDLRVPSRTSVEQYRGTKKTTQTIGQELGVAYLLEGSFQKSGDNVRLIVQLIKTSNKESHAWANEYDRNWKDIFFVQSEVAQTIAKELHAIITPEEKQLIEKIPTTSLTAYDFYQRGQDELTKFEVNNYNKAALGKAENLFYKALKYDSTYAQAYIGLAEVYQSKHSSAEYYFSKSFMDSVLKLCDIALSFDNKIAEAYIIRGNYYANTGMTNKAMDEYDHSLKYNPNSWEAFYGKGDIYFDDDLLKCIDSYQKAASLNHGLTLPSILKGISSEYSSAGLIDKANYYDLEALKLDGDSASYFNYLSLSEKYQGNYEKAKDLLLKAYSIDTTQSVIASQLGICYMFLNQYKESLKYYEKYVEILKALQTFTFLDMNRIGWAYWENGYKKEADYYFDKQKEYCKNQIELKRIWGLKLYPYYDFASDYAFRGNKEKAYENLKIFNQRQTMPLWTVTFLKNDPLFYSIRNEPEFQKIVKDVEAKYQAEHERVRKWLEENNTL